MIVNGQLAADDTPFASVTLMEKVPVAVGVPLMAPVEVFRVNPAGKVPTTEKVKGAVPPVTVIAGLLNRAPTSPLLEAVAGQGRLGAGMVVNGQVGEARAH